MGEWASFYAAAERACLAHLKEGCDPTAFKAVTQALNRLIEDTALMQCRDTSLENRMDAVNTLTEIALCPTTPKDLVVGSLKSLAVYIRWICVAFNEDSEDVSKQQVVFSDAVFNALAKTSNETPSTLKRLLTLSIQPETSFQCQEAVLLVLSQLLFSRGKAHPSTSGIHANTLDWHHLDWEYSLHCIEHILQRTRTLFTPNMHRRTPEEKAFQAGMSALDACMEHGFATHLLPENFLRHGLAALVAECSSMFNLSFNVVLGMLEYGDLFKYSSLSLVPSPKSGHFTSTVRKEIEAAARELSPWVSALMLEWMTALRKNDVLSVVAVCKKMLSLTESEREELFCKPTGVDTPAIAFRHTLLLINGLFTIPTQKHEALAQEALDVWMSLVPLNSIFPTASKSGTWEYVIDAAFSANILDVLYRWLKSGVDSTVVLDAAWQPQLHKHASEIPYAAFESEGSSQQYCVALSHHISTEAVRNTHRPLQRTCAEALLWEPINEHTTLKLWQAMFATEQQHTRLGAASSDLFLNNAELFDTCQKALVRYAKNPAITAAVTRVLAERCKALQLHHPARVDGFFEACTNPAQGIEGVSILSYMQRLIRLFPEDTHLQSAVCRALANTMDMRASVHPESPFGTPSQPGDLKHVDWRTYIAVVDEALQSTLRTLQTVPSIAHTHHFLDAVDALEAILKRCVALKILPESFTHSPVLDVFRKAPSASFNPDISAEISKERVQSFNRVASVLGKYFAWS